jgi:hypothetical protein
LGSELTVFPIRSSTDNAVNKGTKERVMNSRFWLQLLSAFVDETRLLHDILRIKIVS